MNEALRPSPERGEQSKIDPEVFERQRQNAEALLNKEASKAEKSQDARLEQSRELLEKATANQEKYELSSSKDQSDDRVLGNVSALKGQVVKSTIVRTQKRLNSSERAFSKVIHQPVIDAASNATGATIGRPSGLLAGGICSVIASLLMLYICRHYGYEYNFTVGIAGLVGGFALGVLLEGLLAGFNHLFKRK